MMLVHYFPSNALLEIQPIVRHFPKWYNSHGSAADQDELIGKDILIILVDSSPATHAAHAVAFLAPRNL